MQSNTCLLKIIIKMEMKRASRIFPVVGGSKSGKLTAFSNFFTVSTGESPFRNLVNTRIFSRIRIFYRLVRKKTISSIFPLDTFLRTFRKRLNVLQDLA